MGEGSIACWRGLSFSPRSAWAVATVPVLCTCTVGEAAADDTTIVCPVLERPDARGHEGEAVDEPPPSVHLSSKVRKLSLADRPDRIRNGEVRRDRTAARQAEAHVHRRPPRNGRPNRSRSRLDLSTYDEIAGTARTAHSAFSSPVSLVPSLLRAHPVSECVGKQVFRYVIGRKKTPADRPVMPQCVRRPPRLAVPVSEAAGPAAEMDRVSAGKGSRCLGRIRARPAARECCRTSCSTNVQRA